ncbi:hypothetical protein [Streptomyces sp. NPDC002676]
MPTDPYAVLRALLRAEARRSAPPRPETPVAREQERSPKERGH